MYPGSPFHRYSKSIVSDLNSVGLFAGIGGIEFGLESAGFNTVLANEIDRKATKTFNILRDLDPASKDIVRNQDIVEFARTQSDIEKIQDISLLAGGFPCQPFSLAGYRKGFEDDRGNVFWEIERLFRSHAPDVVFLENVKNLKSHDGGRTFDRITKSLEGFDLAPGDDEDADNQPQFIPAPGAPRYFVRDVILNSADFGLPQNRERIFVIAFLEEKRAKRFDEHLSKLIMHQKNKPSIALETLIDFDSCVAEKYYFPDTHPYLEQLREAAHSSMNPHAVFQWRRVYVRTSKTGRVPTLTANMGTGGHNVPIIQTFDGRFRKLTPHECFKLQGIPVTDSKMAALHAEVPDSSLYKQAGNAVSVPVVAALALAIKKSLDD
jgi:DNA (cytosine-5)-methyltransferase 1